MCAPLMIHFPFQNSALYTCTSTTIWSRSSRSSRALTSNFVKNKLKRGIPETYVCLKQNTCLSFSRLLKMIKSIVHKHKMVLFLKCVLFTSCVLIGSKHRASQKCTIAPIYYYYYLYYSGPETTFSVK